ncbi:ABC transporter permease [Caldibacillus thermolactis]|jgi:teichoic acid transport system permease protein|uniref:Transport permease protein n=1 Tax=Pallidibacillus thermolactis TaxID=251051 RepID=A0ABT2WJ92_9BACI|nr:ABC transporter permease [Pallidibacillus thermolactis]MCU9595511.1 ABC transporter permease [Pallidibacillus thermolactis]MCU9599729.1 ABC transporter permease [Pallidibacillus thermolactis subsp. kokeshiiformis]
MKSTIIVIKEQLKYFHLIKRLSLYELKSKNKSNYLGMAWEVINPSIQILIYWFVFGTIIQRENIEVIPGVNVPFIAWLLAGFILWTFFYQATIKGSKSIYSRLGMLSKMNFPMSVIPNFIIFAEFYVHLLMILVSVLILNFMGFFINIYYLQLIYFIFASFCLIFGLSLITSTLSTIIRDVHMFLNAVLKMFLYLTPVLWPIKSLFADNPTILTIMQLNPLFYLIEGYRSAFFGTGWYFIENWEYTLYFWLLVTLLFLIGSTLHVKFRRNFIDYL